MDNEFLTVKDVASKLGVKEVTIYKYLREKKFEGVYFKIGGIFRFNKALLDKYLEDMINND